MKKITNKINGDVIFGHGIDQINNNIRYQKESQSGEIIDSGVIYCPRLWELIDSYTITETNVRELSCNIATISIFDFNLLGLNLDEWEVL